MINGQLMTLPARPFLQAYEAQLRRAEKQLHLESHPVVLESDTFTSNLQDPDLASFIHILERVSIEAVATAVGGPIGLSYAAAQTLLDENPDQERWAALHERNLNENQLDLTNHPGKEQVESLCSRALQSVGLNPEDYQFYTYRRRDGHPNLGNSLPGRIYVHHDLASSFSDSGLAFMIGHEALCAKMG